MTDEEPAPEVDSSDAPTNLGRATATITAWNLVSRLTGFVRVVVTAGALGIAVLGDTYQRTNQVSNVLFELLAGGMLFSVLVPSFVDELRFGDRRGARDLASVLATRGAVALGLIVTAGMLAARPVSALLASNADASSREAQAALGAVLLLFILPQLVLYAVGAVASGLLQADHRFAAVSAAPAFSNVVVIASMIAFRAMHDPSRGLTLTRSEEFVLGGGTLAGTIAMTIVPVVALRRAGLGLRFRWRIQHDGLGTLARRGLWGAGHVGLNQILMLTTIVLAGEVDGGVIAYQTAFTFFLLPHALLAHPIFTALYPRLSRDGAAGNHDRFAEDLGRGLRMIVFLLLPASVLMAVVTPPAISIVRFGQLDAAGTRMVALVLASYLLGLAGYSTFFLLTRAGYALDDARSPTLVNLVVTIVGIMGMALAAARFDGTATLVAFGIVTSVTSIGGSVALFLVVRRRLQRPVAVMSSMLRSTVVAVAAGVVGVLVSGRIGWSGTASSIASATAGTAAIVIVTGLGLLLVRSPEFAEVLGRLRGMKRRFAR